MSVKITNLSNSANEATLRDFFSFCGGINRITIKPDGGQQSAVIEFDSENAAKTASLLTNALIVDRPITVVVVGEEEQDERKGTTNEDEAAAAAAAKRKPSLAAELIASAYLGVKSLDAQYHIAEKTKTAVSQAATSAKQYDEKHHLTARAKDEMKKIDEQHQVAEKLAAAKIQTEVKAKEIDDRYAVKAQAALVGSIAYEKSQELAHKAMEVPTVAKAVGWLAAGFSTIKQTVTTVAAETREIINEHQGVPNDGTATAPPQPQPTSADQQQTSQQQQQRPGEDPAAAATSSSSSTAALNINDDFADYDEATPLSSNDAAGDNTTTEHIQSLQASNSKGDNSTEQPVEPTRL